MFRLRFDTVFHAIMGLEMYLIKHFRDASKNLLENPRFQDIQIIYKRYSKQLIPHRRWITPTNRAGTMQLEPRINTFGMEAMFTIR